MTYKEYCDMYRGIYRTRVLPKKKTVNTLEAYIEDMRILKEFEPYRQEVNQMILGGRLP